MRRVILLVVLTGVGCGRSSDGVPEEETRELVWLEGAGFGWKLFNHRLSFLSLGVDADGARAGVIGGTSTTGVVTRLDAACEASACDEFPFFDDADVRLHWARAEAPVAVGVGTAELVVGESGGETSVEITLEGGARGGIVAVIQGLELDSHVPVEGEPNCYQPANGWLPRRIQVALGEPSASGDQVTVPVQAAFEAGNTLEEARRCVDEVADRARVRLAVDVLVVSTDGPMETHAIAGSAVFPYNGDKIHPDPQVPPGPQALNLGRVDPMLAWSALDWRFHVDDPDVRGAYLRTLDFQALESGQAAGWATNYSPGTQLSGFDYTFEGTLQAVELGAPVSRGTVSERFPAELDEGGTPVVHVFPL